MQQSQEDKKIALVILAAGASTRMNAIKQLLPWKKTTLLGNAIEQGLASKADKVFVVLGANKEKIIPTLKDYDITVIKNKDWQLGLGKSIACAVDFLDNSPTQFDGILIALADQPLLNVSHYDKLIDKFLNNNFGIAATQQNKTIGVPAIFGQKYFSELSELNQDTGAKSLVKKHIDETNFVDANGTALDVDTFDKYTVLFNKYSG